jgi:hypothetical protein
VLIFYCRSERKHLNDDLHAPFEHWYSDLPHRHEEKFAAKHTPGFRYCPNAPTRDTLLTVAGSGSVARVEISPKKQCHVASFFHPNSCTICRKLR